jgi:hypothetical protein
VIREKKWEQIPVLRGSGDASGNSHRRLSCFVFLDQQFECCESDYPGGEQRLLWAEKPIFWEETNCYGEAVPDWGRMAALDVAMSDW